MNWTLIVNPVSGRGTDAADRAAREIAGSGCKLRVVATEGPGGAGVLATEAVERGEGVAVCGGDGTLHEVVNGVDLEALTLGIVPAGRGNDFARALGLSSDAAEAGRLIAGGRTRRVDVGLVGEVRFLTVACAGLDARVAMRVRGWKSLGRVAYKIGAVAEIAIGSGPTLRMREGEQKSREVLLVAFANGGFYGGGLGIAPNADLADGLLDVCTVAPVRRFAALKLLRQVAAGRHGAHEAVRLFRSTAIDLHAPKDCPIVADGEWVASVPTSIGVLPGALTVVV